MPTVAPPASATATLTAALSGTPGTPVATDALAGLFQSVLAQVVSQTTAGQSQAALTDALAQVANTDGTANADLLAGLLALADGEGEDGDESAVNADLLSQLLAAVGGNAQALTQLQQVQQTAETPAGGAVAALLVPAATTGTDTTVDARSPAVQQFLERTGFLGQQLPPPTTATEQPAGPVPPPATEPTSPAPAPVQALPTEPTTANAVPQTVTVADAVQVAGRLPPVVVQPSLVPDRGQQLPAVPALGPTPVRPPINEIQAVEAAPVVAPGQQLDARPRPDTELPIPGTAVRAPVDAAKPAFTLPPGVQVTVTKPAAAPVQPPAVAEAPAAGAITSAAPGITAAVAQPVPTTAVDPLGGFAQLVSARPAPGDQPDLGPDLDPVAVASGLTIQRGEPTPAAPPAAPAASQPTPVSDQLTAPILAHVQARPDAGETELRIRLDPPELGTVKVKIVSTGTDVRAELQVTSEAVRRVVESQLPELRQKLDDAGVRVQRMDVTTDAGGNAGTARDDRGNRWQQEPPVTDFRPLPPVRTARPQAATGTPRNRIEVTA